MTTTNEALNNALVRMKYYTHNDDLTLYKTPGGWWSVIDATFEIILSAPKASMLTLCINAYIKGYLDAKPNNRLVD